MVFLIKNMKYTTQVQKFLKNKLKLHKLERKEFAKIIDIPYTTVTKIINSKSRYAELITILKIANYFQCSIDTVLGRKDYVLLHEQEFNNLTLENISNNLRNFINTKLVTQNLNPYKLGVIIGFSQEVIPSFLKQDNAQRILSSQVIISLADYFQVSIDEMIGRVKPTTAVNSSDENSDRDTDLNTL